MVGKLVSTVEKEKPSPICLYLFFLYNHNENLREEKAVELKTARTLLQFDVAPNVEELPETPNADSERESLDAEEIQELHIRTPESKKKSTYWAREGKSAIRITQWRDVMLSSFEFLDDPFKWI